MRRFVIAFVEVELIQTALKSTQCQLCRDKQLQTIGSTHILLIISITRRLISLIENTLITSSDDPRGNRQRLSDGTMKTSSWK